MERNDFIEQIIGGVFAIIAIIAAIFELILNGFSSNTIVACIKDVFGTLTIVVLFFAVMKDIIPHWNFKKVFLHSLQEWENDNINMISRKPEHDIGEQGKKYYSLDMKTDVSDFYNVGSHQKTGLFVRIPEIDKNNYKEKVEITFFLNKGTFFADIPEEKLTNKSYEDLANRFINLVNTNPNNKNFAIAKYQKNHKSIVVTIDKGIHKKSDINMFIDVINTMYTAYLVSARIKNNEN